LFLALWPDEATQRQVHGIAAGLYLSPRQRVSMENLHVTLVFIGPVDDELLPVIAQQMANIKAPPFTLRFDELSYWRKPRILCLTCSKPDAAALRLAADLSAPLTALGIDLDTRPYSPHVTLARHVAVKPEIAFEPLLWRAAGFALVESVSTRTGVVYQPLHNWRF
jgi:2'-5' RNA ligase